MSLSSHQSAKMKNDEWLTPPEIIKALGKFDLDPCAPVIRPWSMAKRHYTKDDDGLVQPWKGRVWLNPPFSLEWPQWVEKLAKHGNGIALLAARTETRQFFRLVWDRANAVLFLRGRPHFYYVDGRRAKANSGAPICLVAYGPRNAVALYNSGLGFYVPLHLSIS